ncbi:MAG TPA: 30S ribosomal protein S24e [Candidatus Thermoplasmatota archaeon]|nr:30S ribosomal protein S24e [Candidatus Thermoplasmatota archaeon]
MDVKITSETENRLFGRKEVRFTLRHDGETTPNRAQVRQLVASQLGTKTENVVIDSMHSAYGMGATTGLARAYASADAARDMERVHLQKRNNLYVEKPKKGGEKKEEGKAEGKADAKPAAPAAKPAAEKPAAKPAEKKEAKPAKKEA